jgi:protein TonB
MKQQRPTRTPTPPAPVDAPELTGRASEELLIAPDTRAADLAPYVDAWRRKVERLGTLNFPAVARRTVHTRNPVLEVAIAADGRLREARIRRSSGSPQLDQAALDILRIASPFDAFPRPLAARTKVLRLAYEWQFEGAVGLVSAE